MTQPISISQLARIFACVYAGVLPQVRHVGKQWATRGKVLHKFLCDVNVDGYDAALSAVPDTFRESCEAIDFRRMPKPGEFAAEVAFAFNWRDGTARELGRNMDRRYDGLVDESCEIAGTADVVGVTEEAVVVYDYKTGYADLGPAANSWQLKGYAVAAARAYGKKRAVVGFIRIGSGGTPFFDVADMSMVELDAADTEMRWKLEQIIDDLRPHLDDRREVRIRRAEYVEGPHCYRCSSIPFCAAKMRLVAQLAGSPQNLLDPGAVPVLSERELSTAYERLERVKMLVKHVEDALEERAAVTPFPIESKPGYVYGPVEKVEDEVQLEPTRNLLRDRFGLKVANASIKSSMSKASIERALVEHWIQEVDAVTGEVRKIPGRKITPTMRATVEALRKPRFFVGARDFESRAAADEFVSAADRGEEPKPEVVEQLGIRRVTTFPVKAHKAKPEDEVGALPAGAAAVKAFEADLIRRGEEKLLQSAPWTHEKEELLQSNSNEGKGTDGTESET